MENEDSQGLSEQRKNNTKKENDDSSEDKMKNGKIQYIFYLSDRTGEIVSYFDNQEFQVGVLKTVLNLELFSNYFRMPLLLVCRCHVLIISDNKLEKSPETCSSQQSSASGLVCGTVESKTEGQSQGWYLYAFQV